MTLKQARIKATEYADAKAFKSMMTDYYGEYYTVTPTCDFNDDRPARAKWDTTVTGDYGLGETILTELKSRSRKYRFNHKWIRDLRITGYKLDNLREEAAKRGCKAYVVGIYPYDNVMLVWPAEWNYEETIQDTKECEYDEDSENVEQKAYILPFHLARLYEVDMSDFDENRDKALNKYMKTVTYA